MSRRDAAVDEAPRLLATDLDGTLLRTDGTVSGRTRAALRAAAAADLEVVFVTARPHRWLGPVAKLVGGHGLAICANGASVVDVATRTVLEEHGMSPAVVAQVATRVRAALGPDVRLATESSTGFAREVGFTSGHPVPAGSPLAERIESVLPDVTLKLLVRTDAHDVVARVTSAVGDLASVSSSGVEGLAEIAARGVTKASTLARWAAARGIAPAQVWAVGDAPNDLPMLAWAGRAFAVANADPLVLHAADRVLAANDDDGVAGLIEDVLAAR